jgi:hypothetical protein
MKLPEIAPGSFLSKIALCYDLRERFIGYSSAPQVLAGSLSGSKQCLSAVRALHNILGGVVDPVSIYYLFKEKVYMGEPVLQLMQDS